jgi:hypothetical protein
MIGRTTRKVDEPLLIPTVSWSYLLSLVGSDTNYGFLYYLDHAPDRTMV